MARRVLWITLAATLFAGCAFDPSGVSGDVSGDIGGEPADDGAASPMARQGIAIVPTFTDAEVAAILTVANTETMTGLDIDARLDRRAAEAIVAYRAGADGLSGTGDDDPIDTLSELDGITWVGPYAIEQLLAHAQVLGLLGGSTDDPGDDPSDDPPEDPPTTNAPCVIISEYMEGQGNNNKAVELYNCGSTAVTLWTHKLCLIRNGDEDCTSFAALPSEELAPGQVVTLCRTQEGTFNDPLESLRMRCDFAAGSALSFNGDDRLHLFEDVDGDSAPGIGETRDMFGLPEIVPANSPWQDKSLRRCRVEPFVGDAATYDHTDYFTEHPRHDATHLGVAPSGPCI